MRPTILNISQELAELATISKEAYDNPPSNDPETISANLDSAHHAKTSNPKRYWSVKPAISYKSQIILMQWMYYLQDIEKNMNKPTKKMQD